MAKAKGRVEMTSWTHKSKMDPKLIMADQYDPQKHYRFATADNVEHYKEAYGYGVTGKKFKELQLLETSKEHFEERQKENVQRANARAKSIDDSVQHDVNQSGRARGRSMVAFTKD